MNQNDPGYLALPLFKKLQKKIDELKKENEELEFQLGEIRIYNNLIDSYRFYIIDSIKQNKELIEIHIKKKWQIKNLNDELKRSKRNAEHKKREAKELKKKVKADVKHIKTLVTNFHAN